MDLEAQIDGSAQAYIVETKLDTGGCPFDNYYMYHEGLILENCWNFRAAFLANGTTSEVRAAFLANVTTSKATVNLNGSSYHMPSWPVKVLPDPKNVVLNNVKINSASMVTNFIREEAGSWEVVVGQRVVKMMLISPWRLERSSPELHLIVYHEIGNFMLVASIVVKGSIPQIWAPCVSVISILKDHTVARYDVVSGLKATKGWHVSTKCRVRLKPKTIIAFHAKTMNTSSQEIESRHVRCHIATAEVDLESLTFRSYWDLVHVVRGDAVRVWWLLRRIGMLKNWMPNRGYVPNARPISHARGYKLNQWSSLVVEQASNNPQMYLHMSFANTAPEFHGHSAIGPSRRTPQSGIIANLELGLPN
ncbi:hypothetical protein VNO77_19216 [Canavalia gladiata]|uniref:Beta-galactosidase beta-sandwich domain-containing protein n=1 Tax=Canavalia gladiata TaxID=3824 RepID=A0AAN9QKB2_CANGL